MCCAIRQRPTCCDREWNLNTIRAWLGHASLDTTSVYAEIDIERKAKEVALFDSAEPARSRSYRDNRGLMAYLQSL